MSRFFVYKYFDVALKVVYVGCSVEPAERIRKARSKFKETLTAWISKAMPEQQARTLELRWIKQFKPRLNKTLAPYSSHLLGKQHTAETKERIRRSHQKPHSKEHSQAISNGLLGKPKSEAHRRKLSEVSKQRPPEQWAPKVTAMNAAVRGKSQSEEHRRKIGAAVSKYRKGRKLTELQKQALRDGWARRRALGLPTGAQTRRRSDGRV